MRIEDDQLSSSISFKSRNRDQNQEKFKNDFDADRSHPEVVSNFTKDLMGEELKVFSHQRDSNQKEEHIIVEVVGLCRIKNHHGPEIQDIPGCQIATSILVW